jgi:hypothetical protein
MGSLAASGIVVVTKGRSVSRAFDNRIKVSNYSTDLVTSTIPSSGVIRTANVFGTIHAPGGSATSGLTLEQRQADNSVEIQKYTVDATTSGNLQWHYTRHMGIHTSVQPFRSPPTASSHLVGSGTTNERKIFWTDRDRVRASGFDDWAIFDATGKAVGEADGTTDTDSTPQATFNEDC